MYGFIHLYPEAPIVATYYDEKMRMLDKLGIRVMQPSPAQFSSIHHSYVSEMYVRDVMISKPEIVVGLVYEYNYAIFIHREGFCQLVRGAKGPLDFGTVIFHNHLDRDVLLDEPYEVLDPIPMRVESPFYRAFQGYRLYFPHSKVYFDGEKYTE